MKILIDTHYVLWAAINSARMEFWAKRLIADRHNNILVSVASLYEISLKVRYGKIPEAEKFEKDLQKNIEEGLGYSILSLGPEVMVRAARFGSSHGDPFDRMIAAHAIQHNLPILSTDSKLDSFGVERLKRPYGQ